MRRNILSALTLAAVTVLALPAGASAQTPPERGRAGEHGRMGHPARIGMPGGDPAAHILALREELGLTAPQATQIEQIQARLREQNAPLVEQLSAAREQLRAQRAEMTPEEREAMRERMRAARQNPAGETRQRPARAHQAIPEELRPVLEQLQTNTQSAVEQIRAVLTDEQQQKLRELRGRRAPRGAR